MQRLRSFVAVVLGLLVGLELAARTFPDQLAAVSHRVHFKLALLRAKGAVDFVVLGSSRTNDGISPPRLGLVLAGAVSAVLTLMLLPEVYELPLKAALAWVAGGAVYLLIAAYVQTGAGHYPPEAYTTAFLFTGIGSALALVWYWPLRHAAHGAQE